MYKPGTARLIKAGSALVFQMHYTPNGEPVTDRTSVGVIFAKEPPRTEIRVSNVYNGQMVIPPGAANARVDADMTFTRDVRLLSIFAHTHVRGKSFEYRLVYPDGRTETVLSIPRYDFNWQTNYHFTEPLKVPAGTRLEATAYYDNSAANPSNPDPGAEVRWGDQTWEEMMYTSFTFTVEDAPATQAAAGQRKD